jgi:hypothetical protein
MPGAHSCNAAPGEFCQTLESLFLRDSRFPKAKVARQTVLECEYCIRGNRRILWHKVHTRMEIRGKVHALLAVCTTWRQPDDRWVNAFISCKVQKTHIDA